MSDGGHPTDFGYHFKLMMYWGSKWKIYFALFYAFTYEAALAALDGYSFPVAKNKGWAIENLTTREVYFDHYTHDRDERVGYDEAPPDEAFTEAPPILLPTPTPPPEPSPPKQQELFAMEQVWVHKPPIKRRL